MSAQVAVELGRMSRARQRKHRMLQEYVSLLRGSRYYIVADIRGLPASVLKGIREVLRERGSQLKVIKNTVFLLALRSAGRVVEGVEEVLRGQNAVVFTNENPFELMLFLEKRKITREARPGDIATNDIVIPAGNTGLSPGPILSLFGKLKVPTRIEEGSIYVVKDTVVAKAGDVITPELAELLNRLGMKPIESKLRVKAVCIDHKLVSPGEVVLDPKHYEERVKEAYAQALNLALNAALPVPEVVTHLVARAHAEALALAAEAVVLTPETAPAILARAEAAARALYEALRQRNPSL